ncbi:SCO3374 family protein [Streptomyces sp. RPT161]|uniref:SCO3374 family protein n=1 Tax=Streptomyces sp. RPT161 TaxID=3015993 RepID=UPI0022B92DA3|nr:SCO3374 family protein [Streptomyces sp. RPT161]
MAVATGMGHGTLDWYERELGWATSGHTPVELLTGLRFDVLDVPAAAGLAVLRRIARTGPAALAGERILLLVAAGSADELPGLLDWLEWGGIELDLTVRGAGGRVPAPVVPGEAGYRSDTAPATATAGDRHRPMWLRPPEPGREVEPTLPSLSVCAGGGGPGGTGPVGLVPLVGAVATECHRTRILSARTDQPCAFSYASRMVAGTRPRSLTS